MSSTWPAYSSNIYRVFVDLLQDENGHHSVWASNLLGAVSTGITEADALVNIEGVLQELIKSYLEASEEIPFIDLPEQASRVKRRCILVCVR